MVLRIEPDGLVREVFRSARQTPLSLLPAGPGTVFVGTADEGRVLVLDASGRTGLRLDTSSRQVLALGAANGRMAVALSNVAALLVTDIVMETSLLLTAGPSELPYLIGYPAEGENLYRLKGVLSRKKQLVPHLLKVFKSGS